MANDDTAKSAAYPPFSRFPRSRSALILIHSPVGWAKFRPMNFVLVLNYHEILPTVRCSTNIRWWAKCR